MIIDGQSMRTWFWNLLKHDCFRKIVSRKNEFNEKGVPTQNIHMDMRQNVKKGGNL